MIKYSARAAKALGYLKQTYNDIEVFVEDTANQNLWLKILHRVLPTGVRLTSVNMLGGRDRVVAACKLDQSDDSRRRIYIIDGDFDFILGKSKPKLKHLCRLRAYCVENLLINEEAVVEVAHDAAGNVTRLQAAAMVDYAANITAHEEALKKLFSVYATAIYFQSGLQTVGYNVKQLLDSNQAAITFSNHRIMMRAKQLLRALCTQYGVEAVRKVRKRHDARAAKLAMPMAVSGKDYLLPPIHLHLRRACSYLGTQDQLKIQLAKQFHPSSDPYFARSVRLAVS